MQFFIAAVYWVNIQFPAATELENYFQIFLHSNL